MKTKLLAAMFLCASIAVVGATAQAKNNDKPKPPTSLSGSYAEIFSGFSQAGSTTPFSTGSTSTFPESGVALVNLKSDKSFTASTTFNIGGLTCAGTVAGTYTLNPDGTGTSTGTFTPSSSNPSGCSTHTGTQSESFVLVTPNKIDFISTDNDTVLHGVANRQSGGVNDQGNQGQDDE